MSDFDKACQGQFFDDGCNEQYEEADPFLNVPFDEGYPVCETDADHECPFGDMDMDGNDLNLTDAQYTPGGTAVRSGAF